MTIPNIPFEADSVLDWIEMTKALEAGHKLPKAEVEDSFLRRGPDTMLNRAAWIDGLGQAVKTCTIFPGNSDVANINGVVTLYSDADGTLQAILDFHLVTKWKTAGDSLLGALKLARPDSKKVLILGAGTVSRSLVQAYGAGFPNAEIAVWNRTDARVDALRADFPHVTKEDNLEAAVKSSDIIITATMSVDPVLKGEWLQPGQHIDMIGAYREDMREGDDAVMRRSRIFVDNYETALDRVGELKIPLETGVISREDILADYYELDSGRYQRNSDDEITLFKNGGGAHLDLMACNYILKAWKSR